MVKTTTQEAFKAHRIELFIKKIDQYCEEKLISEKQKMYIIHELTGTYSLEHKYGVYTGIILMFSMEKSSAKTIQDFSKINVFDFICKFVHDKQLITIYDVDNNKYIIEDKRAETIRNDYDKLHDLKIEFISSVCDEGTDSIVLNI